jgi:hypothetical protein
MKTKEKTIIMPHGGMQRLVKSTGSAECTCRNALRGVSNTELAMLIRKRALELGGVIAKD